MPVFEYTARDGVGRAVRGRIQAPSVRDAREALRARGLYPTSIRENTAGVLFRARPRTADFAELAWHLGTLLRAGLTVTGALRVLEEGENSAVRTVAAALREEVEAGSLLSQALERVNSGIPPLFVAFVRTGEATGRLDLAFQRLSAYLERELEFRRKVKDALFYPTVVLVVAAVVVAVFLVYLVPTFERVYKAAGAELPPLTLALLAASRSVRILFPFLGVAAGLLVLPAARRAVLRGLWGSVEPFVERMPGVGTLLRTARAARFFSSLGASLEAGIPVTTAVELASHAAGRPRWQEVLRRRLEEGRRLTEALREVGEIPAAAIQLLRVGEDSGQVGEMALRAAEVLDREFELRVRRLLAALEPALIIALAALVGFILVALYMPIFGLGRAVLGR